MNNPWPTVDHGTSELYYESHVTIEPVLDEDRLALAKELASKFNFKVANLLMQKRAEDTPERSKHDTFMTGHGKECRDIEHRTIGLVKTLKANGFVVWRVKLEDTLWDTRTSDVFGLL